MLKLTVVILTMNREFILKKCLNSLLRQLTSSDEVLILMDAHCSDNTEDTIQSFLKRLPLRYYKTKVKGYPQLYNLAVKLAKGNFLVFINDDCEVKNDFIVHIRKAIKTNSGCVIQGQSYSLPKNNIYVEIMADNYQNWLAINTHNKYSYRLKTIDNKNVVIPKTVFKKVGGYNEKLTRGSEDIEFGIRLCEYEIPIIFDQSIVVYHYERFTFLGFIKQHIRIGQAESIVDQLVSSNKKVGMFSWKKIYLHAKSALCREATYIQYHRIKDFLLLPILYLLLFFIRIYSYAVKIT